ncbi:MAG: M23 family metallopeptidase, partial [Burkholderiales bacterium]
MTALVVFAVIHVLVPLALLTFQWRAALGSRAQWLARTVAFAGFFVALHLAGFWTVLPHWLSYAYFAAFAAASMRSFGTARRAPWGAGGKARPRFDVAMHAVFSVLFVSAALYAALGHLPPEGEKIDLAFPLRGGTFGIGSGGSNRLANFHLKALDDPQFAAWRGQSHAVDIVELSRFGTRARGFAPADPGHYAIFGVTVVSPCHGTVEHTRDGLPDQHPPERDPQNLAGNFVFLDCAGMRVLLAHLRQGSVLVKPGEKVVTGQRLADVGNSGNSTE